MDNDTLSVFKLSAQMCGHEIWPNDAKFSPPTPPSGVMIRKWDIALAGWVAWEWNPFTNPAQRDECHSKLLKMRYTVTHSLSDPHSVTQENESQVYFSRCPWEEFDARALAEIGRKG